MNNKPLLSICIPTYNREKKLKELLDSIIAQPAFTDDVEILIYDDPSTDNTQRMVKEYTDTHSNIIYHRNITRVGMTAAFIESTLKCSGEYTWLF